VVMERRFPNPLLKDLIGQQVPAMPIRA
jgi:hypothetical protein